MATRMTPSLRNFLLYTLVAVLVGGMYSCSRKKNTFISRNYHKLTGRDNYYFNGREKVKAGAAQLAELHEDQYDRLLKVFRYADEEKAKSVFPDMDEAIKKASIVIQRHSMIFDGEEKNPWVRESYLLIGKAHFYKHDYWAAIETFQFVASSYSGEDIRYEALMWLTQCYLELGKTPDAEYLLDFLKNDQGFPWKKKTGEYAAIAASYHIQKDDYETAAMELQRAVDHTRDKRRRIRYMFILGQLYQEMEEYQKAYALYEQVSKRNSTYEMEFNARINSARCYDITTGSHEIKERLLKMIRDEKNRDYLDQIYYALATIAQREDNEPEAIGLYRQSISASTTNTNQKALSYLELAEIFFKRPEYRPAQIYYDSTVTFLSEDHPDYDIIFSKKSSLAKLVKNLNVIQLQDSLLALAGMTEAQRKAAIDAVIASEIAEREREKAIRDSLKANERQLEEIPSSGQPYYTGANANKFKPTGAGWYFYNPSTVSFGVNEFAKRWGKRELEDNWRRSSKGLEAGTAFIEETPEEEVDSTEAIETARRDSIMKLNDAERKKAYLESVPLTEEEQEKAHTRILEAYYNVGLIYKEQLLDYPASARTFETMMSKYPENRFMLPAYYNLYRTYMAMGDTVKAEKYKDILLIEHPDSEYAKLILNPNYYQENLKKTAILQVYYENTFRAYKNRQYYAVIDRKQNADSLFPPNELSPKFAFLEALAIGKTRPQPDFEASLKKIIARYPRDSVSVRARDILDRMANMQYALPLDTGSTVTEEPAEVQPPKPKVPFKFSPDTAHYFMVMFAVGSMDANDLKIKFSDYNKKYYSTSELTTSDGLLQLDQQFVMVRAFENGKKAGAYMKGVLEEGSLFHNIDVSTLSIFTITPDNMILLVQSKDLDAYKAFYKASYSKGN